MKYCIGRDPPAYGYKYQPSAFAFRRLLVIGEYCKQNIPFSSIGTSNQRLYSNYFILLATMGAIGPE